MRYLILFLLIFWGSVVQLSAQNCLGIENLDVLNVAREVDLNGIDHVIFIKNKIVAQSHFKFVQLRNTETFILVPDAYQGRVIDINGLLPQNSRFPYAIDLNRLTARLSCETRSTRGRSCRHIRIAKNEVGCSECQEIHWTSASAISNRVILIPPYKKRS